MGCPRQHQGRGVKLHKFQIADLGAGLPGHGDAVAAGLRWVGGVGVEMAAAACGQHNSSGLQPAQAAGVQHLKPAAAAGFDPELQGQGSLQAHQPRPLQHPALERIHQGTAGAVLGVQHAPVAVGGLERGAQAAVVAIEVHPQLQQPLHAGGGFLHQQLHRWGVAEATASPEGVVAVAGEAVVGVGYRGNAPLGPAAGGAGRVVFAQQQHPQLGRQLQGRHQPCGPTAHHDHIPVGGQLNHGARGVKGNKKAAGRARRLEPVSEFKTR